jgi:hypothetical protein
MEPNPGTKAQREAKVRRNEESPLYIKGLVLKCDNFFSYIILNI